MGQLVAALAIDWSEIVNHLVAGLLLALLIGVIGWATATYRALVAIREYAKNLPEILVSLDDLKNKYEELDQRVATLES